MFQSLNITYQEGFLQIYLYLSEIIRTRLRICGVIVFARYADHSLSDLSGNLLARQYVTEQQWDPNEPKPEWRTTAISINKPVLMVKIFFHFA